METYIFFDTNIVYNDFQFRGFEFKKLLSLANLRGYKIRITELNFEEIIKHYNQHVSKVITNINSLRSDINKYGMNDYYSLDRISKEVIFENYRIFLQNFLNENEIEIIKTPSNTNTLQSIFRRYFDNIKPFSEVKSNDKPSFPDAILWETLVDFSNNINHSDEIYFISKNYKDFSDKVKTQLNEALQEDIPNCQYSYSIADFFELSEIINDERTLFDNLGETVKIKIEDTFEQYSENAFQDYIASYLLNNEFEATNFNGWGEDLYISKSNVEFSEIIESTHNLVSVSFDAEVQSEFDITTPNPMYEKDFDDGTEQYINEPYKTVFNLYGSFTYNTNTNQIEESEFNI